jgi:predicted ABC-type ATPase
VMEFAEFDRRPILVAIAGPNGAGKTTFFHAHLASAGLRFVNADVLAAELAVEPYHAARLSDALRKALVGREESFVFETVFSDPVGDKVAFLTEAARCGYVVVLCYIGLSGPDQSLERVAMRVSQGGHDVPDDKLRSRFSRSLVNLQAAIAQLPHVLIYDNRPECPISPSGRFRSRATSPSPGTGPRVASTHTPLRVKPGGDAPTVPLYC